LNHAKNRAVPSKPGQETFLRRSVAAGHGSPHQREVAAAAIINDKRRMAIKKRPYTYTYSLIPNKRIGIKHKEERHGLACA
jgi:hypothetical protein